MGKPGNKSKNEILRQKAEALLKKKSPEVISTLSESEIKKLFHELQVYQVELEMQNDELLRAKAEQQTIAEKYSDLYDFAPCGYFTLSKDGKIIEINQLGATMLGKERVNVKNSAFSFFVSNVTRPIFHNFFEKTFRSSDKETCEVVLISNGNLPINVLLTGIIRANEEHCKVTAININELVAAKTTAQESNRLKSAFLANMSHEIRTPMNGILGLAEILKNPNLNAEKQHEYIGLITKSGERLLNIINNIINISKIESGSVNVSISETNVNEQLNFIYHFFKPMTEKKALQLSFTNSLTEKESVIETDIEMVYAILTNLVNNAIKFTSKGSIEFGCSLKPERDELEFFVKDTGIGIPADQLSIIFERFRQVEESRARSYEGTGLGLSISKAFVEMLGGKLWVESEFGKGSAFYFTIPYKSDQQIKDAVKNAHWVGNGERQNKNLKIVIAEDDEGSAAFLKEILQIVGGEMITAKTGAEAVATCRANPDIDLVLMDIQMPVMDGYEATRHIRQLNKKVVIIAQTAYAMENDKEKALEAGCTDYISKPIKPNALLELIEKHFEISTKPSHART